KAVPVWTLLSPARCPSQWRARPSLKALVDIAAGLNGGLSKLVRIAEGRFPYCSGPQYTVLRSSNVVVYAVPDKPWFPRVPLRDAASLEALGNPFVMTNPSR